MARQASLKAVYRPRIKRWVVLHRGKVICRAPDYDGVQAFLKGWREAEAERRAAP